MTIINNGSFIYSSQYCTLPCQSHDEGSQHQRALMINTIEIKCESQWVSVILRVRLVGSHDLSSGWGQHHAVILVKGVGGQRGAVLQAVWMDVGGGGGGGAFLGGAMVSGVGPGPVRLQLGVMHELRGHVSLAGMSQGVLHRPLQLHPTVLEPVTDLREEEMWWDKGSSTAKGSRKCRFWQRR